MVAVRLHHVTGRRCAVRAKHSAPRRWDDGDIPMSGLTTHAFALQGLFAFVFFGLDALLGESRFLPGLGKHSTGNIQN